MSKSSFETTKDVQVNDDSDTVPPSAGERILLTWTWGIGSSLLIVMFVWSCYQGLERTLHGAVIVAIGAYLTGRIGRTKRPIFGGLIIFLMIIVLGGDTIAPGYIVGISLVGFMICSLLLTILEHHRKRWAYPLVILTLSIAFSFSVRYFHVTAAWIHDRRAEVPMKKLSDRLEYEAGIFVGLTKSLSLTDIREVDERESHPTIESDWDLIDFSWNKDRLFFGYGVDRSYIRLPTIRQRALCSLHSETERKFTAMPEFGVARIIRRRIEPMSKNSYEFSNQSIPLQIQDEFWPTIQRSETQRSNYLEEMKTPLNTWRSFPFEVENANAPFSFHVAASQDFLDPKFFGFTNEDRKTAGFVEHAFHYPPPGIEINHRKWELVELQLLSLERFDQPVAYVLDNLPRMDQLNSDNVPTRPLDEFELQALEKLRAGERIVVESDAKQSEMDQMRMLGSLPNRSICMQCHSGDKTKLLGAFTYRFKPWQP